MPHSTTSKFCNMRHSFVLPLAMVGALHRSHRHTVVCRCSLCRLPEPFTQSLRQHCGVAFVLSFSFCAIPSADSIAQNSPFVKWWSKLYHFYKMETRKGIPLDPKGRCPRQRSLCSQWLTHSLNALWKGRAVRGFPKLYLWGVAPHPTLAVWQEGKANSFPLCEGSVSLHFVKGRVVFSPFGRKSPPSSPWLRSRF